MTWLQPPAHVHAMLGSTWQPHALNTSIRAGAARGAGAPPFSASAARSADGATLVARFVNRLATPVGPPGVNTSLVGQVELGRGAACASCRRWSLTASSLGDANPSWQPGRISPVEHACAVEGGGRRVPLVPLPPNSFHVVQLEGCTSAARP